MKVPIETFKLMEAASHTATEKTHPPVILWREILLSFIRDEYGRGVASLGLYIGLVALMAGVGYGIWNMQHPTGMQMESLPHSAASCNGKCGMG